MLRQAVVIVLLAESTLQHRLRGRLYTGETPPLAELTRLLLAMQPLRLAVLLLQVGMRQQLSVVPVHLALTHSPQLSQTTPAPMGRVGLMRWRLVVCLRRLMGKL